MVGYGWLPHGPATAWFLTPTERRYAASRIITDRLAQTTSAVGHAAHQEDEAEYDEESRGLLQPSKASVANSQHLVDDRGLGAHDLLSAVCNTKIWHILACNILSSIPVYAFSVFLPLVLTPLLETPDAALVNLLTVPPHLCGAAMLFLAARYSDQHRIRLLPVLVGLCTVMVGLILVVVLPTSWAILRYLALCILLSGTYVASPLTVAWISGNTPSPGKRTLLLGINGWGNLAGILAAMLFKPKYADSGYLVPFWWTLASVSVAWFGYFMFLRQLKVENQMRRSLVAGWSNEDIERENTTGQGPLLSDRPWLRRVINRMGSNAKVMWLATWLEKAALTGREGDEKITFVYGL